MIKRIVGAALAWALLGLGASSADDGWQTFQDAKSGVSVDFPGKPLANVVIQTSERGWTVTSTAEYDLPDGSAYGVSVVQYGRAIGNPETFLTRAMAGSRRNLRATIVSQAFTQREGAPALEAGDAA